MDEITGPILAITFVLLSVFVPVAFIPGISGQLFRQFAVAVSVSMLISALNALTLSPALCAVLLKHGEKSSGPMRYVLGGDRPCPRRLCGGGAPAGPRGDSSVSWSWPARRRRRSGCSARPRRASCRTRTRAHSSPRCGFPKAPRINRTEAVVKQVEDIVRADPGCPRHPLGGRASISSTMSHRSNQAFFVIRLKPYEERTDPAQSAGAIIARLRPQTGGDPGRDRISVQPAAHSRPREHRRFPICAGGAARPVAV